MPTVFIAGVLTFLVDQITKYWVVHVLELDRLRDMPIWPPFLNFKMAWNYGINFGLFQGDTDTTRWILIGIALLISGVVLWWIRREPGGIWQKIAAGLLIGGAMGNVVDRLVYGAVADFLNMSCCGIDNPYAFNVADIAVFAGAVGMVIFTGEKKAA
ncbi:signal peptidase II [Roseovarius indicus]|jgi:signal peptidase II|uniref:Lipoprotein signal peptidase n=1 Tax=Roseovarius indicus TaxID=540747 RepID=A0A0T5P745_9RHOB|nr:signal peptidase II [Roseovarius indicus]KRS16844.1 lipoprotein signal peptidase [Roseovarius indicus]OAO06078.1 signal peptidase II [Roseovarius indicus]QEW24252.1 Lipoprotein signal peptidase [Roseovarius indicus]SFD73709.1 signal peptidase II [Roseovarius indicus]